MKTNLRNIVGAGVLVSVSFFGAAQTWADSLADALVGAYNHSGLIEQNRAVLRAADEDVAAAGAALLPVITWTSEATRSFGNLRAGSNSTTASITLNASLLLYDFGAASLNREALKETVLATRQQLVGIEQQVLLNAVSAYMNVRQATEFVALRNNNLRLLTQELRAAKDRFEVGEVTRTDVALAEARMAQARAGLAGAQGDLLIANEVYLSVVGRRPGRLNTPPRLPAVDTNVERAKARALRAHPEMLAAQHQVSALELGISRAKADMLPKVELRGSLGVAEQGSGGALANGGSVSVSVGGPIYRGGALSSALRKVQARRDAARGNLHVVRHNIAQNVGQAIARLAIARASLEANERQIRAARVAFRGVREEATLGARTTLDVLDAEQELLDAEAARISAQSDQYVAAYTVLSSMGQLTAQKLKLNVQTYDPAAYYNLVKTSPAIETRQGRQLERVLRALQKD